MKRRTGAVPLVLCLAMASCGHAPPPARAAAAPVPAAAAADVAVTIFFIGDAGAPAAPPDSEAVLVALRAAAAAAPHPVIVFLGDNVYPRGLPDSGAPAPERAEAERRLAAELGVVRVTGARGIFVPGNHDWDREGRGGWDAIRRQERFIAAVPDARSVLLPGGGCPGPTIVDLEQAVRLVALDTEWWLHDGPKPVDRSTGCATSSGVEVVDSLRAALRSAGRRAVVVIAHHPLESGGPHGGHFGWQDHVFPLREVKPWLWIPLPLLGSAYPIARENGITSQDVSSSAYRHMRAALDSAFAGSPPILYAAGHDHGLQVIAGGSVRYLLVSGAGIFGHRDRLTALDSTKFVRSASGFMRVEFLHDGRARLSVTIVDRYGSGVEAFASWLD